MTGRNRTIIILAVVLLVLAGTGFWLTSTPATPPTPTPEPTVVVWDYSSATTEGLSVQSITSTVALQVVGGHWQITAPVNQPADDVTVTQEANSLKKPDVRTKIGDNVTDLTQYGLASPAITVTLVLSGATTPQQRLFVGKTNVDGSAYYVRPGNSNSVYLIPNTLVEPLNTWLQTPPVMPPTPTPLPATVIIAPTPPPGATAPAGLMTPPAATDTPAAAPAATDTPAAPAATNTPAAAPAATETPASAAATATP